MRLNTLFVLIFSAVLVVAPSIGAYSQISVVGADCALGGGTTGYLYSATGNIDSGEVLTWKVSGGIVAGSPSLSATSINAAGTQIRVVWSRQVSKGSVSVTSQHLGTYTLNVTVGSLNNTLPSLTSQPSKGGMVTLGTGTLVSASCQVLFDCWWEVGPTQNGPFEPLDGQKGTSLYLANCTQTQYYRRVISYNSDVMYSNPILVDPQ
ncbi:MAG TPA: hypothetical protein VG870_05485 [Chitinophagaceae bacterium]|nr:hypothetical protein [Chitinophagaceae bacterium]